MTEISGCRTVEASMMDAQFVSSCSINAPASERSLAGDFGSFGLRKAGLMGFDFGGNVSSEEERSMPGDRGQNDDKI